MNTTLSDAEFALAEAKNYCPDYPWTQNTATEAVWALGQSLLGVEAANNDLWKELKACKESHSQLRAACKCLDGLDWCAGYELGYQNMLILDTALDLARKALADAPTSCAAGDEALQAMTELGAKLKSVNSIWEALAVLTDATGAECGRHLEGLVFREISEAAREA